MSNDSNQNDEHDDKSANIKSILANIKCQVKTRSIIKISEHKLLDKIQQMLRSSKVMNAMMKLQISKVFE